MAQNEVFFIDDDLIERLLRGDAAPASSKQKRPAASSGLATAVAFATEGKLDEAVRELEAALQRGENPSEVQSGLGHLRFEQQKWSEAQGHYAKVAEQEPKHQTAHYNLGLCLERRSKFEDAAKEFEAALAIDPKRWQAQVGRGLCLLRLNRPEAALPCWDAAQSELRASKKPQRQDDILFGKAVTLHQLGRLDEAAELYQKLLQLNPNSIDLLSNMTALAGTRKEEARAKEMAERLLKIQPDSRVALECLASVTLSRGDFSAAAQVCSHLVKAAPDSYEGWFNLGVAYQKTGRLEQAANSYREALRLRPQAAEANANLGAVLQERGDMKGARAAYQQALEVSAELPGVLWNLVLAAERDGNAGETEKLLERLLAAEPDRHDATFRLGYLQLQRGEYAGAVDSFEACLKKRKDWLEARLNLGLACWKFGDLEAAAATFRVVLGMNPKQTDALRSLAAVAIEQKNAAEARETVKKLDSLGAATPELTYNLGLLLQSAGDHNAAAECYRTTLQHKPQFSGALINLGHALRAVGKDDQAKELWSQAVAADPELAARYFR
jgi:tetratricopeptide (TPR) repeat protein